MVSHKLAVLLPLAVVASAANMPAPAPAHVVRDIVPRQSLVSELLDLANQFGLTACIPQALPLVSDLPTLPSGFLDQDLIGQALSQTTLALSDVCSFSITGTIGTQYTDFLPTLYSWYDAHKSTIDSLISDCTSASALQQTVESYETCSQVEAVRSSAATETTSSSSSGASETESATGTGTVAVGTSGVGSGSTESSATASGTAGSAASTGAAAPRQTGIVAAAAVAAGFMGAVIAL
ncbi:hypothetical protein BX600DRAFT_530241 [Xylariales sp. PMI_506]|nr:hypothetical protein BX600DRAFT_530241 [Xylariales sp. PMI_506]